MIHTSKKQTRFLCALAVIVTAACGKKGPPLAPFARVPAAVATVTGVSIGRDVYLSFAVPVADIDGEKPADVTSLKVYAVTAEKAPDPSDKKHLDLATLIATVPVRPIMPELPPAPDGTPLPPLPLPPGVNRDDTVVVREEITAAALAPVVLPLTKTELALQKALAEMPEVETGPIAGPLVAPPPTKLPHRYYFVIGISSRERKSLASTPIAVTLDAGASAPGTPLVTYTESAMTITWEPPPDARTATMQPPVTVVPVVVPANASPGNTSPTGVPSGGAVTPVTGNVTPAAPAAPVRPILTAKSLGFTSEATTYHVYQVPTADDVLEPGAKPLPDLEANPFALTLPKPLTPAALAVTETVITGVTFGKEHCFFVRAVDNVYGAVVQSPASPTTCVSPVDTFPPAAPLSLAAIVGEGVISLIWEPNTEKDLAGYLVLRGDAPGDTLRAITPEPVVGTTYRDTTARPGTRYAYVVVAVDRAMPQNVSAQSNRVEEAAR